MKPVKSFLFSAAMIFLFFGCIEGMLRLSGFEPVFYYKTHAIPSWMEEMDPVVLEKYKRFVDGQGFVNEDVYAYRPDLRYGYRLKPNLSITVSNYSSALVVDKLPPWTITSDSQGFRSPTGKASPKESSGPTLHVLGDSSSFGWGVDYEKSYPALLVEKINANTSHFNLRNLSLPGFSSFQGKLLWQEWREVKSGDWVILSFGWNDSFPSNQTDTQQFESRNSLLGKVNWNLRHFLLYRWMRTWQLPESPVVKKQEIGRRVSVTEYQNNLESLVTKVREKGARPVLLSICNFAQYHDTVQQVAANKEVPFFDFPSALEPFLPTVHNRFPDQFVTYFEAYGERMEANPMLAFLFPDRCHPNEIGHSLMADILFQTIKGEVL